MQHLPSPGLALRSRECPKPRAARKVTIRHRTARRCKRPPTPVATMFKASVSSMPSPLSRWFHWSKPHTLSQVFPPWQRPMIDCPHLLHPQRPKSHTIIHFPARQQRLARLRFQRARRPEGRRYSSPQGWKKELIVPRSEPCLSNPRGAIISSCGAHETGVGVWQTIPLAAQAHKRIADACTAHTKQHKGAGCRGGGPSLGSHAAAC